ncbi:MAG: exodeoxyribonuclease VII small subunit [Candidatus Zixiibacteriota bacterium]|nr:MAG: exodeoxyribonuclease VII small subunit [candidate division Zixibacteria bacterium]
MTTKKKYKDFESALARLEEITDLLESGEKSLEESINYYTEGLEIAKFCNDRLAEAEKNIKLIADQKGTLVEEDFEEENGDDDAG